MVKFEEEKNDGRNSNKILLLFRTLLPDTNTKDLKCFRMKSGQKHYKSSFELILSVISLQGLILACFLHKFIFTEELPQTIRQGFHP